MNLEEKQFLHTSTPPPVDDQKTEMTENEYEQALNIIEQEEEKFYRNDISYQHIITIIQGFLKHKTHPKLESILYSYLAIENHNYANTGFIKFNLQLDVYKQEQLISRTKREQLWENYSDREQIEEQEKKAIQYYQKALEHCPFRKYLNYNVLETLLQDLKYRQIQNLKNSQDRKKAIDKWNQEYINIIDDFHERGKQDEAIMVFLVNQQICQQNLDHLMYFYHALPEDDHRHKVDHVFGFGKNISNINFKSYSDDSYVREFNNNLSKQELTKIQNTNIQFLQINSQQLRSFYLLSKKEDRSSKEQRIYTRLLRQISKSVFELLGEENILQQRNTETQKEKQAKITKKMLLEYFKQVRHLIELGFLLPQDKQANSKNYIKIIKAQKHLEKKINNDKKFREKLTGKYKKVQNN